MPGYDNSDVVEYFGKLDILINNADCCSAVEDKCQLGIDLGGECQSAVLLPGSRSIPEKI